MKAIHQIQQRLRWRYGIIWSWDQAVGVLLVAAIALLAWWRIGTHS